MTIKLSNDRGWLERMAKTEDYGTVTAGGLLARACGEEETQKAVTEEPRILGRLIELARRGRGLSAPELAKKADVELAEVVAIELNAFCDPQPRTVVGLAKVLGLPATGLMRLAGLAERRDDRLSAAVVRFAAKAEPTAKLSDDEKDALEEFVRVLAELSDRK